MKRKSYISENRAESWVSTQTEKLNVQVCFEIPGRATPIAYSLPGVLRIVPLIVAFFAVTLMPFILFAQQGTLAALEAEFRVAQTRYVDALRSYGSTHEKSLEARGQFLLAKKRIQELKSKIDSMGTSQNKSFADELLPAPTFQSEAAAASSSGAQTLLADVGGNALPTIVGAPSRDEILAFKYGVITGSMVNIRTGAGTTNSIITTLPAGTPFEVKDYRAGWYKVSFSDGRVGWIAGWLVNTSLKPVAPAAPAPAPFGGELGGSFIASGSVTSEYGYRSDPFTGERRFHSGIDIGAPKGTAVLALGEGTVVSAAWNDGYGRLVKIRYDNGYTAYYAHLDDYAGMAPGKRISRGQTVGKVDSSGRSTGHHLHFELRNESGETLDPRSIASVVIP